MHNLKLRRLTLPHLLIGALTCASLLAPVVKSGADAAGSLPVPAIERRNPPRGGAAERAASRDLSRTVRSALGSMPLQFTENRGQLDPRVAFYVHGRDTSLYFTRKGLTFSLAIPRAEGMSAPESPGATRRGSGPQRWAVSLDFVGGNRAVEPRGEEDSGARFSYFKGPRERWKTGLKSYGRVVYSDLWPGIDLVYSGTVSRMKYEFVVRPGADPSRIRLAYRGANSVGLNDAGQIEVTTPAGTFRDEAPVAYQEVDGRRVDVSSRYALGRGSARYGFKLGNYDRTRPLVIDPAVLIYSGFIGGGSDDFGYGVAVDSSGNAYVTGYTNSTNFPTKVGPDTTYNGGFGGSGDHDAFIVKVKATPTEGASNAGLEYAGFIGGTSYDQGTAVAVDSSGNAYVVGYTISTEASTTPFPVKAGSFDTTHGNPAGDLADAFVVKVNSTGTDLNYGTFIGGSGDDIGNGIAVDSSGNAYVGGYTSSGTGFPTSVGPDLSHNGNNDAFITKLNPTGTAVSYSGFVGGTGNDYCGTTDFVGNCVAVDFAGNAYLTGSTASANFPSKVGPDTSFNGGDSDAFVVKVKATPTEGEVNAGLDYAGFIGGSGVDVGNGIAVDQTTGVAHIAGTTGSNETTFPDTSGPDTSYNGGISDAFVAKVNVTPTEGSSPLAYCGYIGGSGDDKGNAIAIDSTGNAYVTGGTTSTESSPTPFPLLDGPDSSANGLTDAFITKLTSSGSLSFSGFIGGNGDDEGLAVAADANGKAYVTGYTYSSNFPTSVGPDTTFNSTTTGDAFITKVGVPAPGALQFSSATYSVSEGGTKATITVTRTGGSDGAVSVNYATSNGTATAGSDYTAASGTLNFADGETSKTFDVNVTEDSLDEPDETVNLTLSSPGGGATLGSPSAAVLTITDNDDAPVPGTLQFSAATYTVGEGAGTATITVTRTGGSGGAVSVNFATSNGTAASGSDYTAASGTLNFAGGETSKTFSVTILDDTLDEPDETVNLTLSSPTGGATLGSQNTATLTITDNDPTPSLSINDVSVSEGNSGTTSASFTVTLSAASSLTVTVNFATADATATTADGDYQANSGTLTFNPGETQKTVAVQVNGDAKFENNETFVVNLSSPSNATVSDSQGQGTITNDDSAPTLSISDVTLAEGNSGTIAFTFTVTKVGETALSASVNFATADGTATAGSDYQSNSGTLNFAASDTSKTITVLVNGDTANETNETFFVNLSGASGATVSDSQGQGTITNDDTPTIQFQSAVFPAGEGSHFVTITVTRTGDTSAATSASYATSDGTANERSDYTTALGTVRFAAGETSKTFDVLLTDDGYQEGTETFTLTLSGPTGGAVLGTQSTATVSISDNDPAPASSNPINTPDFFVRMHYHDFLNREPDSSGFSFWTNQITECEQRPEAEKQNCREVRRINVSAAFFLSPEFQETGFYTLRVQRVAFGRKSAEESTRVKYTDFIRDARQVGEGFIDGQPGSGAVLEANKNAYAAQVSSDPAFTTRFPLTQTAEQYVDALFSSAGLVPTADERQSAINAYNTAGGGAAGRAAALRNVSDATTVRNAEFRAAFVLMEYFGYLRRDPDQDGYNFWLQKLNQFNGDYIAAEMVKAFITSGEYRIRFAVN